MSDLPPGISVTGGTGGTSAHLADLELAATALDRAAEHLVAAAAHAARVSSLVEAASRWSPATVHAARADVAPLVDRWHGAGGRADRARETATDLRTTAGLYVTTDRATEDLVRRGLTAHGIAVGEAGPLGWVLHAGAAVAGAVAVTSGLIGMRMLRRSPTPAGWVLRRLSSADRREAAGPWGSLARTLGGPGVLPPGFGWPAASTVEAFAPGLAGVIIGSSPGRASLSGEPVAQAARVLASGAGLATLAAGGPAGALVVTPVVRPAPTVRAAAMRPRTSADVLRQVEALYPTAGGSPGTVSVQQLDHTDGTRTWVVNVPGTQDWSPTAGSNPMDTTTNLRITGGLPQDATRLVTEAMSQAGVAPGDPVLLAGHSQGGIVAMQVAADPDLARRFSVEAVLTAGSPVGAMPLPEHVQALHLESAQDYVPALDATPSPDVPHRTTVRSDLWQSETSPLDQLSAASPVTAHDVGAYGRTAESLEGATHPSLQAFDATLGRLLGDGGTTMREQQYVGVRVR